MEKSALAAIAGIFLITLYSKGDGRTFVFNCSSYTVHKPPTHPAPSRDSLDFCKQNGGALVSIETQEELNFLEETLSRIDLKTQYYIGLRNVIGKWRWISNNSIVVAPKKSPWDAGQPSGNGNCAKMYFNNKRELRYDDIPCRSKATNIGIICERPVDCRVETATRIRTTTPAPTPVTSASQSSKSTQQESTGGTRTTNTIATPFGKANSDIPSSKRDKDNSLVIVVALTALAVIILVVLILLWLLFVHRPRSKALNSKTQPDDSNQHQESSTQITVHASLTPLEERRDTYETVNEDKQEHIYNNVEKSNRKRRCEGHRESSVHIQETSLQTHSKDGYLVPSDQSVVMEAVEELYISEENSGVNETRGDHVYAVVQVHPDQGTATFVKEKERVQRQSLDLTCPSHKSSKGESLVESEKVSSVKTEKPATNNDKGIAGQKDEDECKDYLYAVVDKANKKRKVPQMPSPYCIMRT